ncbi:unnamed protein product, partial [Porites lobata]
LIFIVSLAGDSLIVIIVYKTQNLSKPINYFIANMASSDLLFPIFSVPWRMFYLHTKDSFLIGGQLGQALSVDRFGAVVFPLRSPLITSKLCPFFILATWIVAVAVNSPFFFANELVESPERNWCVTKWKKVFGDSSSYASFQLAYYILFLYIPAILLLAILYSIIFIKLKTQVHPGEQSANTQQQRNKRSRKVLQMSIAIVTVFLLCWLLFTTNILIIMVYKDSVTYFSCSFWIYFHVTYFTAHAYCAINPIICFIFSTILYSIIFIKLKTQVHPGEQSANTQQQRNKRSRKVLQMSIAIVTVFLLCWLLFTTNIFIIMVYKDSVTYFCCSFWIYFHVTYFTAHAYCAINPIICFIFSSNYRQGAKRLIKCSFVRA